MDRTLQKPRCGAVMVGMLSFVPLENFQTSVLSGSKMSVHPAARIPLLSPN